eukprot:CAMPEP_0176243386 /NCGR_PEP_ID=MMETSP0121_2-20121125/30896_1 /TAXON_ID=160619 /ORGANISM="Kryptoperidinium foliaceum, Strain CCMP 1326" /LENGTH=47 /DNA_ID= /DNA_START= /DNA_END= /DNA_ORIENTATION=
MSGVAPQEWNPSKLVKLRRPKRYESASVDTKTQGMEPTSGMILSSGQ